MTSRFRSNWGKERCQLNSVSDSGPGHDHSPDDEFRGEFECDDSPDDDIAFGETDDKGISRDRSLDNGNGKLGERSDPGMSHYVDDRELDEDRENKSATSFHASREDFRFRGDLEVENYSPRERRAVPIVKRATTSSSSFAIGSSMARYNLTDSANDEEKFESRLSSTSLMTTMTTTSNGNCSMNPRTSNAKQVKRIEPRHDRHRTIGSLTRGERPVIEDLSIVGANPRSSNHLTDPTSTRTNESFNGSKRDRSLNRSSRNDEFRSPTRAVFQEIDHYGPIDRSAGTRATRDRSYSPIANGSNGDSPEKLADRRRKNSRTDQTFYSPDPAFETDQIFHSPERRSKRNANSYSPADNDDGRSANRSRSRDKHRKLEILGSSAKRLDNGDGANGSRSQRQNGSPKKPGEIDDNDFHTKKGSSGRKSRYKASPEEFDVQIHRYERALRVPRRDSDLSRKTSFRSQESDLSRKSSFEDHQRSKESNPSKNKHYHKYRNPELARGSSEDREDDRVCRKNSFDTDLSRKSSLTRRNLLDTGPVHDNDKHHNNNNGNAVNNNHNGKNGSRYRDRSEFVAKSRATRCNDDDYEDFEDHDQSSWKNDRHSRPLTPPKQLLDPKDRDDSRDPKSRISCSGFKEPTSKNAHDSARNYVQDHNHCRSKKNCAIESLSVSQGHDRFSSSSRRVSSTRSLNDTYQDHSNPRNGARAAPANNKQSTREFVLDQQDPCADDEHLSFSTIERNGTTVIKIRTNSLSPVGQTEPARPRRRTSHRTDNNSATRYRKYEDEAEDEDDEDDDTFGHNYRRRDYRIGPRRLWTSRDGGVQITDLDEGQPCLHCGETCPGFSPHSWRKNCTSCKCPREAHDVCHEEWVSVRARLGLKGEGPNNYVGFDPRDRGLTWAPPGLPPSKVEEYFSMLPEISVPRIGTPGERHRDRQLATQLPKQDLARAYCRHLDSQHSASADDFMAARNEIALDIGSVKEILERGHNCGVCQEPLKYGSLVVSASKLGFSYHPSCFQCTQCRELLVDLAYCVHDDALYCERHYAEQLKPRCAACDELIFSGEYTKAMNKDWHSGHFCCWQCDESLTGQRYVLRDEHPYCIKCYESVFANGCEECSKIIGIDSKDLSYKDKHWHEACFLCNKCRVSLVDKQFGSKVDKIYCGNCYDAQFASRCDGCGEIFRAGTKKMEYKTRQWHEKCFCCVVCRNPIGTKSFIPREQEIYCAGCYEDKFATRCVKCNKIITSGGVTYKNEPWHRDCFTCSNCNNSLAGQRFTSRDDKPYCAECFGELFAKRCTACTKPITGIGGTRFISFEDRHWHNNCFICAGCNTSLVGRGFITDGDDIICPECAKQKLSE